MLIRLASPGPKAPKGFFAIKEVADKDMNVRVSWLTPMISLDTVKEIAHTADATVNDGVCVCVCVISHRLSSNALGVSFLHFAQ